MIEIRLLMSSIASIVYIGAKSLQFPYCCSIIIIDQIGKSSFVIIIE